MGKSINGKNLGKGFTQRKDGLYQGTYYVSGKRYFLYDRNLRRLKQKIKEVENTIGGLNILNSDLQHNISFNKLYDIWFKLRKESSNIKDVTLANYNLCFNKHIKNTFLGKSPIININKVMCETVIFSSSNKLLTKLVIISVLGYAIENGLIKMNPAKNILIKQESNKSKVLSLDDQKTLIKYINHDIYKNFVILALHTGLRGSELCGLETDSIDFDKKILTVKQQLCYEKNITGKRVFNISELKTKSSHRIVPLDDIAINILKSQINLRTQNLIHIKQKKITIDDKFKNLLFITHLGKPLYVDKINMYLRFIYNNHENEFTTDRISTHMFRHTFATMCLNSDMHTRSIQSILGHNNDKITELYAHVTEEKLYNSIHKLNEYIKSTHYQLM